MILAYEIIVIKYVVLVYNPEHKQKSAAYLRVMSKLSYNANGKTVGTKVVSEKAHLIC